MRRNFKLERLQNGESFETSEKGNSMVPLIKSGQKHKLEPATFEEVEIGDIAYCKVKGNFYTHLVTAKNEKKGCQISNNQGYVNGWTKAVFGVVVEVVGGKHKRKKKKKKNKMKKIVVLSGAGISKESGIETFRDGQEALWNKVPVSEVATPQAFVKDPEKVLNFYNERRNQLKDVEPNQAHIDLSSLEDYYNVNIITQNIDDLHERGGSSNILHIHGELTKAKTNMNPGKIHDIGYDEINLGDLDEDGNQLRPDVVWFGESVPKLGEAERITKLADILIVVGTSLGVYPAAGLINRVGSKVPIYLVDPNVPEGMIFQDRLKFIQKPATEGIADVVGELIKKALEE